MQIFTATSRFVGAILLFSAGFSPVVFAQRELSEIPTPDPAAEMAAMGVADEAAVNLFAKDPATAKPIQINFDCTGALWVASSEIYPQIKPGEIANDKIMVLRDTNGDGSADQWTVFADGLLIPTGVVPDGPDAAYVAESTQLIYLRDSDGDGKADQREVIFSGFGTEDTHHLLHTLRWGPDGCLYFNQSIYIHSHIDTVLGTRHLDGGGIWRYRPTTGQLEVFCKGFINPWGHVFDQYGESFVTDGAFFEGINYAFPDAVFVASPGAERWLKGMNPGSPKHCGLEILSGTHVPPSWQGDLVTNDFRGHRVCRFTVRPNGSGYESRQQPEVITSSHVAFRPIDARMGPDGALYIADWYNPIIQHGEVDFRDQRRDREHGRIWRVSFPQRELDPWPNFLTASIAELIRLLEDPSLAVRQFAREQLWRKVQSDQQEVIRQLQAWVEDAAETTSPARLLEWLWMDEVIGHANPLGIARIGTLDNDPSGRAKLRSVSRNQANIAADDQPSRITLDSLLAMTDHPDPRVRLEAVISNGNRSSLAAAENVIAALNQPLDENLDFAAWQAVRQLKDHWIAASHDGRLDWQGRTKQLAFAVSAVASSEAAEIAVTVLEADAAETADGGKSTIDLVLLAAAASAGNPAQLGRLLDVVLARSRDDSFPTLLAPLLTRTRRDGVVPQHAGPRLHQAVGNADDLLRHGDSAASIITAAQAWKTNELARTFATSLPKASAELKSKLISALGSFDTPLAEELIGELVTSDDPTLRIAAAQAMMTTRPGAVVPHLVELLREPATAQAGIELVVDGLRRQGMPDLVARKLNQVSLSADTARVLLRSIRTAGGNESLESAVRHSGQLDDAAWKWSPQLSKRIQELARTQGSPRRGEAIYRRQELQCIECHAIGNAGGVVGPNLISLGGSSQLDYIVESLLDPNAKLKEGYSTLSVLTEDGELVNGIPIGQSEEYLTLRLADGKEQRIAIDSIEAQQSGNSLMPAGMLDQLTETELADLVAFLSELGRTPEYTVATAPIARRVETLIFTPQANRRLNRTSTDTVAGDDPELRWRPLTSWVDGTFSLDEMDSFQQHKNTPPTSFIRFHVNMSSRTPEGQARPAGITLPMKGVECWIDGKPCPIWDVKGKLLEPGIHTLVLGIDRTQQIAPFEINLGDWLTLTTLSQ